jgi:hypothetical protein
MRIKLSPFVQSAAAVSAFPLAGELSTVADFKNLAEGDALTGMKRADCENQP